MNYTEEQPFKEYYLYNGQSSKLQKIQMTRENNELVLCNHTIYIPYQILYDYMYLKIKPDINISYIFSKIDIYSIKFIFEKDKMEKKYLHILMEKIIW